MRNWIIATVIIGIVLFVVAGKFQKGVEKIVDDKFSVYETILLEK